MRNRLFGIISTWAVEYPVRTLIIFSVFTVVCLIIGSNLTVTTRWADLLPEQDPSVQEFNKILEQYESASSIMIVIKGEEERIKAFTDEIAGHVKNLEDIKYVLYKTDIDFYKNHSNRS